MKDVSKNKKILYGIMLIIILIGIIMTATLKLNFSLMYRDNTRIKVYLGKEYNINDIKSISEEVFDTKNIEYQEIDMFKESISIIVSDVTDEQIDNLTNKIQEKYEIEDKDELIEINKVGHVRFREIINPYILPMVITAIMILVYVGIRYAKLGVLNVVITLLLRTIVAEALLVSIVAIARIPVNIYLMPVAVGIYLIIMILTIEEYQKKSEKLSEKGK